MTEDETAKKREAFIARGCDEETRKARAAWLKRIEEQAKLPPPTIVEEEVEWAQEVVDKGFQCPFGQNFLWCDCYRCAGDLDVYDNCLEFQKARQLLRSVAAGYIRVQWRTMKVRL